MLSEESLEVIEQQLAWLPQNLQEKCLAVEKKGYGICVRCKFKYGCNECSFPKAVKYWLKRVAEGYEEGKPKKSKKTRGNNPLFEEEPDSEQVEAKDEPKVAGSTLQNRWHEDPCL